MNLGHYYYEIAVVLESHDSHEIISIGTFAAIKHWRFIAIHSDTATFRTSAGSWVPNGFNSFKGIIQDEMRCGDREAEVPF